MEGHVPAFCLQPGKKLPNHTQASWERYSASPETSVPVIGSFDRYLPMTLAYEWMVSGNYYDKTRYAMVQTYFWGCLAGFEQDWDIQEETMKKLEWAIGDGRVLSLFHEMRFFFGCNGRVRLVESHPAFQKRHHYHDCANQPIHGVLQW